MKKKTIFENKNEKKWNLFGKNLIKKRANFTLNENRWMSTRDSSERSPFK